MLLKEQLAQKGRYRSIKYRSISTSINPKKLAHQASILSSVHLPKTKAQQKSLSKMYFKSSNDFNEFAKSISLEKNLLQSHKFKTTIKDSIMNRTSFIKDNPQKQFQDHTMDKSTYIQQFQDLMDLQTSKQKRASRISIVNTKLDNMKAKFKCQRISFPNIIEYDNSQFTALDNINLPIAFVQEQIQKCQVQIKKNPQPFRIMREQIKVFKSHMLNDLEQFYVGFLPKMKKLRQNISLNAVYQQEHLMKSKRQIQELADFLPPFVKQFEHTHNRQAQLQAIIFQTAPFELQLKKENEFQLKEENNLQLNVEKDEKYKTNFSFRQRLQQDNYF